jgi:hypothetical protein
MQLVRNRLSKANLGDLETFTDGTPSHTAGIAQVHALLLQPQPLLFLHCCPAVCQYQCRKIT